MLTPSEKLEVKLIISPAIESMSSFTALVDAIADADLLAAIRKRLVDWEGTKLSANKLGLVKAHCVEFDATIRQQSMHCRQSQIKKEIAVLIGWQLTPVLPF